MKARRYFLLTALSGMVGMLSLIATSLFKHWIVNNPPLTLSDEGLDQLIFYTRGLAAAMLVSQIAIASFVVFLVLYFVARGEERRQQQLLANSSD